MQQQQQQQRLSGEPEQLIHQTGQKAPTDRAVQTAFEHIELEFNSQKYDRVHQTGQKTPTDRTLVP